MKSFEVSISYRDRDGERTLRETCKALSADDAQTKAEIRFRSRRTGLYVIEMVTAREK